eukprot:TRINITY_DN4629_c0_g2_i4.p1 TRINITY_DN4629_c0_g2~~TRINITY_DN4629_c0_g2_i4.p1  ORF type:complete len:135 (+),score=24.75 TRINITY_DN4629_c0_g2_i4:562-966(+)
MIVDDNDYNLFTLERKCRRCGYGVITAYNGKECIEKLLEHEKEGKRCSLGKCRGIGLILMDIDMPIMNGIDATIEIQRMIQAHEISPIDIVGCSAFESKQDIAEGLSLIHISEPTRQAEISYAVFCLKKKKKVR